jgi:hypothetical protein
MDTSVRQTHWISRETSCVSARHWTAWRALPSTGSENLATAISDEIGAADRSIERCLPLLRRSDALLVFSDYGGGHKAARYEVMSFLVTTPEGISAFLQDRQRLRDGPLGVRRMAFKSLNDNVRLSSLPEFLAAADVVAGLLLSFAVDKAAAHRLGEPHRRETAFGELEPWASRSFRKLTTIGHLAGILVQGLRNDGQNLLWITR